MRKGGSPREAPSGDTGTAGLSGAGIQARLRDDVARFREETAGFDEDALLKATYEKLGIDPAVVASADSATADTPRRSIEDQLRTLAEDSEPTPEQLDALQQRVYDRLERDHGFRPSRLNETRPTEERPARD